MLNHFFTVDCQLCFIVIVAIGIKLLRLLKRC